MLNWSNNTTRCQKLVGTNVNKILLLINVNKVNKMLIKLINANRCCHKLTFYVYEKFSHYFVKKLV